MKTYIFRAVVLVCLSAVQGSSQTWLAAGAQQFGSFNTSNFEVTNLGDLNLHFEVPVFSRAGRGTPFAFSLTYDSSVWGILSTNGQSPWVPMSGWGWNTTSQAPL